MDVPAFPKPGEFAGDRRVRLIEETGRHVFTDPSDGTEYEFDEDKGAWFPMWNESLMEQQQSAYGTQKQPEGQTGDGDGDGDGDGEGTAAAAGAKRKGRAPGKRENTSVYVSGLPRDVTEEEVAAFFAQCGALMPDLATSRPRIKLYCDESGAPKGDALVTYFKAPSVQLAVDILDDSPFRASDAARIHVEEAKFSSGKAGDAGDAEKAKRPRVDAKLARKRLDRLERRLGWDEDTGEVASKHKRTVILKHMFTLEELEEDVTLLLDLSEDVRTECEKLGKVTSVKVYDGSAEGVVAVRFGDEQAAEACVKLMHGRFFAGRQVEAAVYDGRARLGAAQTGGGADGAHASAGGDDEARMERYAQWLDAGE